MKIMGLISIMLTDVVAGKTVCGSRYLAIDEPKAMTELSTAALSRNQARAVVERGHITALPST